MLIDWLPAKKHLDHLRDRRLVVATLRGIKRPVQMIRAGIPAARHNRNACMSTAPPGRIGVKSTENLKVPNPAVYCCTSSWGIESEQRIEMIVVTKVYRVISWLFETMPVTCGEILCAYF